MCSAAPCAHDAQLLSEQISYIGYPAIINAKFTAEIKGLSIMAAARISNIAGLVYSIYQHGPHFTLRRIELNNVSGRFRRIDKFNAARYHACIFLYQHFVTELEDSHGDSSLAWVVNSLPCGTPIRKQLAGLSWRTRRIGMKQDARKNWHRRKRQKRRLAMRKYIAGKKSKGVVA